MVERSKTPSRRPYCQMKPFRQGDLDALCSVYAVINAARLAVGPSRLSHDDWLQVFHTALSVLKERDVLYEVMVDGSGMGLVRWMLKAVQGDLASRWGIHLDISRPFIGKPPPRPIALAKCMARHIETGGSAIIHLRGQHHHWTVVDEVKPRILSLFDSDGMKQLRLSQITTGSLRYSHRAIKIVPHHVVLLDTAKLDVSWNCDAMCSDDEG